MTLSKMVVFLLELINCYAAVYYSNFIFFYMKSRFHFAELENLLLAAASGIIYMVAAWQGGIFAQKKGYTTSLYVGYTTIVLSLAAGLLFDSITAQVIIFGVWSIGICFIWPALEALVCDKAGAKLSDMIGIYNVTWAGSGAIAYFSTGMLLERLGMQSLFWLPLCLTLLQILILPIYIIIARREKTDSRTDGVPSIDIEAPTHAQRFQHMAWLANPLSYIAINTVIPLIPTLSGDLGLSTAVAGIVCSIWMFGRLIAFLILWRWKGWHYKFWWLIGSFVFMVVCFVQLILSDSLTRLILAQIGFGLSIGLIYYSSLYYSMHGSENQGAHGGLHEAMIGAGLFVGPACGAAALLLLPTAANGTIFSVSAVLSLGFCGMVWTGGRRRAPLGENCCQESR